MAVSQRAPSGASIDAFTQWANALFAQTQSMGDPSNRQGRTTLTPEEAHILFTHYQANGGKFDANAVFQDISYLREGDLSRQPNPSRLANEQRAADAALGKAHAQGNTPAPTTPGTTPGVAPSIGQARADVNSAAQKLAGVDPGLGNALQQFLANGGGSQATLFPGTGVDPQATVRGYKPGRSAADMNGPQQFTGADIFQEKGAGEYLKDLYKMSSDQLDELRYKLFAQGWYGAAQTASSGPLQSGEIGFGKGPDPLLISAYGAALGEAARYNAAGEPYTIDAVIDMGAPAGVAPKKAAKQGTPFVTTNPADLRAALRAQFQQDVGHDPSEGELQQFAGSYISQETGAQRELIKARDTGQDSAVSGPPSPTAGAQDFIDTKKQIEKSTYGAAVRQQAFYSMLKSPV